jgi:hypothetical protein
LSSSLYAEARFADASGASQVTRRWEAKVQDFA